MSHTRQVSSTAHPEWVFGFDFEPENALEARRAILSRAAKSEAQVLGYHFSFPGLGYSIPDGNTYMFIVAAF